MRIKQGTFLYWWANNILDNPQDVCSFVKETVMLPILIAAFVIMLGVITIFYWAGLICLYGAVLHDSLFLLFVALLGFAIQMAVLRDWLREDSSQAQWAYDILTYDLFEIFKREHCVPEKEKEDGVVELAKYYFKGIKEKMCVRIDYVD